MRGTAIAISLAALIVGAVRYRQSRQLPRDMSRGGIELVYDLDLERVVDERFQRQLEELVERLRRQDTPASALAPRPRSATLTAPGLDEAKLRAALAGSLLVAGPFPPNGLATVALPEEEAARIADAALQQIARIARERIAGLELCVPSVKQSAGRIVVGLPGVDEAGAARVKRLLAIGGRLEVREVDPGLALVAAATQLPPGAAVALVADPWRAPDGTVVAARALEAATTEELERARAGFAPSAFAGGYEALAGPAEGTPPRARLYLVKRAELDTADVRSVAVASGRVEIALSPVAADRFTALTARLVGRKLAFVLDRRILSAPLVMESIPGGQVSIALDSSRLDPSLVAAALRSGALPSPLTLASEREYGPGP